MNPNIKTPKNKSQLPKKPNIVNQIIIAIFIFVSITMLYTFFVKSPDEIKELTISDVAKGVTTGTVEKIEVSGSDINISFKDGTKGMAKKEVESSLSETLFNYGVTPAQISGTPIEIKTESGFGFWLLNILPFLIPVLIIVFFVWMLTRQVKGQGMQAFSFGQSQTQVIKIIK
jgi:cell division protease FtsH